jgi:hypothetical protein
MIMEDECWLEFVFVDGTKQTWEFTKIGASKILSVLENDTVHRLEVHGELIDPDTIQSVWQRVYQSK